MTLILKLDYHLFVVVSRSTDPSITQGLFPPSSKMHGTRFSAAAFATNFPFSVPPVNIIRSKGYLVILIATYTPPSITR